MLRKKSKPILVFLLFLSILVFLGVGKHVLVVKSTPEPISKNNIPQRFDIIGITKTNKPVLLEHKIGKQDQFKFYEFMSALETDSGINNLSSKEQKDNKEYSFYIDAVKKGNIEKTLAVALNDNIQSVTIRILEDNPLTKQQKIRVDYWNDDSGYFSVYEVNNRSVKPLEYADMLKSDGALSFAAGFAYMLLTFGIGCIVLGVAIIIETKWRKYVN